MVPRHEFLWTMFPHSMEYTCLMCATHVICVDTVPLKNNVALARILLGSIVCESSEQHAMACVNSSVSVLYTRRLSSVLHAQ